MSVELSVILPTRDRPEALAVALESIAGGSLASRRYEVVVADNSPALSAAPVVARFRGLFDHLVHVPVGPPGLHEARHAGLRQASAAILVYADDDIVAGPRWLESILAELADPTVALVGGNVLPRFAAAPPVWLERLWNLPGAEGRCLDALSLVDLGERARDVPPEYVFGCNFAVRRAVVEAAGGFHPDGFPEALIRFRGDGETHVARFIRETGRRARFAPGASIEHVIPVERMVPAYFERRSFAQGVSDSYTALRAGREAAAGAVWRGWLALCRPPALAALRCRWRLAYWRGYRFHQREARRDSALLEWVCKSSYL